MNALNTFLIIITFCLLGFVAKLYIAHSAEAPAKVQPVEVVEEKTATEDKPKERARPAILRVEKEVEVSALQPIEPTVIIEKVSIVDYH